MEKPFLNVVLRREFVKSLTFPTHPPQKWLAMTINPELWKLLLLTQQLAKQFDTAFLSWIDLLSKKHSIVM